MAILKSILIAALLVLTMAPAHAERIKDLAQVEGVRSNALIGYGLVVGLNGTGDGSTNSPFTVASVTSMLERMGVNVRADLKKVKPKNVAAVMVTAELPAFARPGQQIDVTVSSLGDAKSLRGGTLLITPLVAGNNEVYAVAQGSLIVGGFTAGGKASSTTQNHPTAAVVPNGAKVERAAPQGLSSNQDHIILTLNNPDFTTAKRVQDTINAYMGSNVARAMNGGTVEVLNTPGNSVELIASLENLDVTPDQQAVVVVDERTGTIVMGQDVRIDTVAVAHGNISVSVSESPQVSQPNAFSDGKTKTVDRTDVQVNQEGAQLVVLPKQVSLSELVNALNAVGATPNDLIAILQAIKAAGALYADLRVI